MEPKLHFRDAAAWMAKAPPFPHQLERPAANVLRFPVERTRQDRRA